MFTHVDSALKKEICFERKKSFGGEGELPRGCHARRNIRLTRLGSLVDLRI